MSDQAIGMIERWWLAARPKTLWAAVAPVILGSALAYYYQGFHAPSALAALMLALLIQIGTNFANDYYDFIHGADTEERKGPLRLTQAGLIPPHTMKKAFVMVFAVTFLGGLYLVWRGGWPILLIGVLSILFGILYTGGPWPLAYVGLGDLFVLVFFGPVAVGGTFYVQTLTITPQVLWAGSAPGVLATAILVANNLRDLESDRKNNKLTLAARFGTTFSRWEYSLLTLYAFLLPVYWYFKGQPGGKLFILLPLLSLPLAIPLNRTVWKTREGAALNQVLAGTGKLLLIYSILFSLGWVL